MALERLPPLGDRGAARAALARRDLRARDRLPGDGHGARRQDAHVHAEVHQIGQVAAVGDALRGARVDEVLDAEPQTRRHLEDQSLRAFRTRPVKSTRAATPRQFTNVRLSA